MKYKVVVAGDYNIDLLKASETSNELKRIADSNNFKLHILRPTRKESCLDQILSNISEARSDVLELGLSDHETAQSLAFAVNGIEKPRSCLYRYKRDYSSKNVMKFRECLTSISWSDVYNEYDPSEAFAQFHMTFTLFYKLCFPLIKIKTNTNTKSVWFTRGIKKSITTKRRLRFRYYSISKHHSSQISSKINYNNYSKILRRCIHQAQKISNVNFVRRSKNIGKATWDVIKNVANKTNTTDVNLEKLVINNNTIDNPKDIANYFNDFYINLTNSNTMLKPDLSLVNATNANLFLVPIDENEICNIIKNLNPTKSAGYDEIQTTIIKECKQEIATVLSYLVNLSLTNGVFPEPLKISLIKPLFKKGNKESVENYRPIALLSVISKVFEKAFHVRVLSYLDKFKIIKAEQFGFQRGKSTTLAAFTLSNNILGYMNMSVPVTAVFFDMSRAFDFVNHETLLAKCELYGIRGVANEWLKTYLNARTQYVEVTQVDSTNTIVAHKSLTKTNRVGVPQGSIMGPLLFLLYVNDLPNVTNFDCTLFADDLSIVIPCRDPRTYNNDINDTITEIMAWLGKNNLRVNIDKTTFIQFVNRNGSKHSLNVVFEDQILTESSHTKFLGIWMDETVSWKEHINNLCSKLNSFSYALWKLTKVSTKEAAIQAYHGYICSLLRYGILLWGNSSHVRRVLIAQKQCVRALCNVNMLTSCKPLFRDLKLLTVPCIYIYEVCLFVKSYPNFFNKKRDFCKFNTRYPDRLAIPHKRTKLYGNNAYCMSISIYNRLHDDIKELPLTLFKCRLKKWLIQECFYSVNDYFEYYKS
jgi:hypothetical protein